MKSNLGENPTVEKVDDCNCIHNEADVTMVSFVLEAAKSGQHVICILSDDTDVFALLDYWVNRADLQCNVSVQRTGQEVFCGCIWIPQATPAMHATPVMHATLQLSW